MFTSDFNWANDGAIRFFYEKNQNFYSAQLRMFHGENSFFITDSQTWAGRENTFLLSHFLNALKYMPQEGIRRMSPDADAYSVSMRRGGAPGDYARSLQCDRYGMEKHNAWNIHLEVQPLHKAEGGGYTGSGSEVLHLFYSSRSKVPAPRANPLIREQASLHIVPRRQAPEQKQESAGANWRPV